MKYRKKPIVIEAVQWNGHNFEELKLLGVKYEYEDHLVIPTLEGDMRAGVGDWIIKEVKGEMYPVRNDIFQETYEKVEK